MIHALKLLWLLVRNIIFSNPEEYNFRSDKFNARKFIASIMLIASIILNSWQIWRHYDLGKEYSDYRDYIQKTDPDLYQKSLEFRKKKP